MNLTSAAIEAAANELHDREGYATSLADAPLYRRERFLGSAREVLEAAAPHMCPAAHTQRTEWPDIKRPRS